MTEDEARLASKKLDTLYRMAETAPGFRFRWRTRQTERGWEAEIWSAYRDGPTPWIGGTGTTEAAAIDAASSLTLFGWTETTSSLNPARHLELKGEQP